MKISPSKESSNRKTTLTKLISIPSSYSCIEIFHPQFSCLKPSCIYFVSFYRQDIEESVLFFCTYLSLYCVSACPTRDGYKFEVLDNTGNAFVRVWFALNKISLKCVYEELTIFWTTQSCLFVRGGSNTENMLFYGAKYTQNSREAWKGTLLPETNGIRSWYNCAYYNRKSPGNNEFYTCLSVCYAECPVSAVKITKLTWKTYETY